MDLSNVTTIERETILKSWKDCHGFIQNKASFMPEIRALDPEGKLKIAAIEIADKDVLRNHVQSLETNFAVLNQYGFYVLPNESKIV